jgi:drug/metabolite transporter (DMT)-like permease
MMMMTSMNLIQARGDFTKSSIRWGFMWALGCAVLWGAWYVGTAVWYEIPYVNMAFETNAEFLREAGMLMTFNVIAVLFFLFVWCAVLGKLEGHGRAIRQMRSISKWFFIGAIFGGSIAILGSYLAIGYVGGAFAAIAALTYPLVGLTLARLWYKKKITACAAVGIFIILAGGVTVYGPGIISELTSSGNDSWLSYAGGAMIAFYAPSIISELTGSDGGSWLGYAGGAMVALGWGIEGAIAGRGLKASDPEVNVTVLFTLLGSVDPTCYSHVHGSAGNRQY